MLVNHLQFCREKQKYLQCSIFSCLDILGKCILSFFLPEAPNCFYFIGGFVKEKKNHKFLFVSLIWFGLKIQGKCISFSKDISWALLCTQRP